MTRTSDVHTGTNLVFFFAILHSLQTPDVGANMNLIEARSNNELILRFIGNGQVIQKTGGMLVADENIIVKDGGACKWCWEMKSHGSLLCCTLEIPRQ